MRVLLAGLTFLLVTPTIGGLVFLAALLRSPDRDGSIYDWGPRVWARAMLWAGGVRLQLHHPERIAQDAARIYVSNHVSYYDVFALAAVLPRYKWIAKAELLRIPIFGSAARAAGMIFIERHNRKAAFAQYQKAAESIHQGASVIVCPEGTRGDHYGLRAFKKGPFVLAIASGVPIVPTVVYGTREVLPRGSWRMRRGVVHIHFLEEISTCGYRYDERNVLARLTWDRMADALHETYGIASEMSRHREAAEVASA